MDESAYEAMVERLKKVNAVIEGLDPSIKADAFDSLKPYVTGRPSTGTGRDGGPDADGAAEDELVSEHDSDDNASNLMLAVAIVYQRSGLGPHQLKAITGVASQFSLVIPARPDRTFPNAKRDGAEVIRKQADGWKITPRGEKWLRKTYGVKRG